jgi:hypothetical protein
MGVAISTSDMSVTPQADLAKENEQLIPIPLVVDSFRGFPFC